MAHPHNSYGGRPHAGLPGGSQGECLVSKLAQKARFDERKTVPIQIRLAPPVTSTARDDRELQSLSALHGQKPQASLITIVSLSEWIVASSGNEPKYQQMRVGTDLLLFRIGTELTAIRWLQHQLGLCLQQTAQYWPSVSEWCTVLQFARKRLIDHVREPKETMTVS